MIRMLLEDMLADLGYGVTASAGGLNEAIALARNSDFDLAILDVNLNGDAVYPVADLLMERGVPFVFSTGYGDRGLPEPYRDRPPAEAVPARQSGKHSFEHQKVTRVASVSFPRKREPISAAAQNNMTTVVMGPRLRGDNQPVTRTIPPAWS